MSIKIPIVSDFDGRGIKQAVAQFKSLEKTSEKAQFAIRKATLPAAAAITALGGVMVLATKAAIEDQKSQVLLARQLRVTTGATDQQIAANEEFVTQMMYASAVADDELRPALATLVRASGSVSKAQEQLKLALDISAGSGKSLETVTLALSKAQNGNLGALTRLGIPLDANIIKTKDFDAASQALADTFGGAAATSANTFEGRMKKLKIRFDETKEAIGTAFLPILEKLLPMFEKLGKFAERNAPLIITLGVAIAGFATAILAANVALKAWNAIAVITKVVNWALATSFTAVQVSTGVGIATAFAAAAAFVVITQKMKGAAGAADSLGGSLGTLAGALVATETSTDANTNAEVEAAEASAKLTIAKSKAAEAARKLKNALKEAKSALRDDFNKALEAAQQKLESAQDAFTKFASSISDALTSSLNFQDAYDAGKDTGSGFIAGLTEQAAKIKNFGVLVNRLIAGGLSEAALTKVLDAGVDAGTAIAEELLNGADNILRANELVAEVQGIADLVGKNSATKFYEAGVIAGQNLVAGVQAAINSFEIRLNTPGLTTEDINAMRGEFGVALTGPAIPFDLEDFNATFNANFGNFLGNIPMFADGGVVNSPTLGIIGESGPEAVIPLDRMGGMGGGINITVNAGLVSTPDQIGQEIIQAIQKAQRRSGPVFAPA
jgi:hypothetical protein